MCDCFVRCICKILDAAAPSSVCKVFSCDWLVGMGSVDQLLFSCNDFPDQPLLGFFSFLFLLLLSASDLRSPCVLFLPKAHLSSDFSLATLSLLFCIFSFLLHQSLLFSFLAKTQLSFPPQGICHIWKFCSQQIKKTN